MADLIFRIVAETTSDSDSIVRLALARGGHAPSRERSQRLNQETGVIGPVEVSPRACMRALQRIDTGRGVAGRPRRPRRAKNLPRYRAQMRSLGSPIYKFGTPLAGGKTSSIHKRRTSRQHGGTTPWVRVSPCPHPAHGETRSPAIGAPSLRRLRRARPTASAPSGGGLSAGKFA